MHRRRQNQRRVELAVEAAGCEGMEKEGDRKQVNTGHDFHQIPPEFISSEFVVKHKR